MNPGEVWECQVSRDNCVTVLVVASTDDVCECLLLMDARTVPAGQPITYNREFFNSMFTRVA